MSQPFAFNPLDPATRRDPYPLYARWRRESPVFEHTELPLHPSPVFRAVTKLPVRLEAA